MIIEGVTKLTLEDDEYLFIQIPKHTSLAAIKGFNDVLKMTFGEKTRRIILHDFDTELKKVRIKDDPA